MPVRQLPGQCDNHKSHGGERDQDESARRPKAERGDEGRDFVRRQIAEKAVVGAEVDIQRHHDAKVNCADDKGAPQILPTGPEGKHRHVENGVAKNDGVRAQNHQNKGVAGPAARAGWINA